MENMKIFMLFLWIKCAIIDDAIYYKFSEKSSLFCHVFETFILLAKTRNKSEIYRKRHSLIYWGLLLDFKDEINEQTQKSKIRK